MFISKQVVAVFVFVFLIIAMNYVFTLWCRDIQNFFEPPCKQTNKHKQTTCSTVDQTVQRTQSTHLTDHAFFLKMLREYYYFECSNRMLLINPN